MGIIDASFWTVGALWNETLSNRHWLGGMFLSFYILPSFLVGFIVARWGIYKGKKKMAEKFLLLSGILFALLGFYESVFWQIFVVLMASTAISVSYPLVDGVYSDIVARMGRERKHMIGLSNSTMSIAYIVGPPLSGLIANFVGEQLTFVVLGISTALIASVLLFVTPKKLLLPQEEIHKWKD
jgi:MFS family permease